MPFLFLFMPIDALKCYTFSDNSPDICHSNSLKRSIMKLEQWPHTVHIPKSWNYSMSSLFATQSHPQTHTHFFTVLEMKDARMDQTGQHVFTHIAAICVGRLTPAPSCLGHGLRVAKPLRLTGSVTGGEEEREGEGEKIERGSETRLSRKQGWHHL